MQSPFVSKYYHFIYNDLLNSGSRATALYCLLSQAGSSLTAREKQMSASQPLVFLFTGYSIAHQYKQVFEAPLKNSD